MTSTPKMHWDSKQSSTQPNNCNSLPLLSGGTVILNRFLYNPYVHLLLNLAFLLWTWEREGEKIEIQREREREVFRLRWQWNRATESPTVTCQAALYFYHLWYLILSPTIHLLPIALLLSCFFFLLSWLGQLTYNDAFFISLFHEVGYVTMSLWFSTSLTSVS